VPGEPAQKTALKPESSSGVGAEQVPPQMRGALEVPGWPRLQGECRVGQKAIAVQVFADNLGVVAGDRDAEGWAEEG